MKLYESYLKESKEGAIDDLIMVKNGFCYPAFFFNFVWFLYKGMLKWSLVVLAVNILISILFKDLAANFYSSLVVSTSVSFGIALNANYVYSEYLQKKGYKLKGCIFGKNKEDAEIKFISNLMSADKQKAELYASSLLQNSKSKKNKELIKEYFNRDFKDYFAIRKF
jgi:hypothetical protein